MWLIVLYEDADRAEFIQWMRLNSYEFKEFESIPLLFEVQEPFDHPAIKDIEGSDWQQTRPSDRQPITVNPDLFTGPDNWVLPRVIRRDKPWVFSDKSFAGIASFYEAGLDGAGVDIYVIDSGFNASHVEFGGRATNVADYTGEGTVTDGYGHGTACASAAAGITVGTARGSLLWSFRVFTNAGTSPSNTVIVNAINAAITHYNDRVALNRPAVMNLSMAGSSSAIGTAAASAISAGIVVVAAAGNDSASASAIQPGSTTGVVCIGGSNANDGPYYTTSNGTNWGSRVDVLAPSHANRIADHLANNAYKSGNGTSYGCGVATGLVACLLTGKSRLSSAQVATVRQYLIDNATTGRFKLGPTPGALPDRLIYLDPELTASPFVF